MGTAGDISTVASLLKLYAKGPYTSDPNDPSYERFHHTQPLPDNEKLEAVYQAVIKSHGLRSYGTVRQTDQAIYVDPGQVPHFGKAGKVGGAALAAAGLERSYRLPLSNLQISNPTPTKILYQTPDLQVAARTDSYIGRPKDLGAWDQLKNALRVARG
jgi:hypothetical protein